jgi:hypothetical protein
MRLSFSSHFLNTFISVLLLGIIAGCSDISKNRIELDVSPYTTSMLGESVLVFDNSMNQDNIQMTLEALHEQQKHSEFGSERYALILKPKILLVILSLKLSQGWPSPL